MLEIKNLNYHYSKTEDGLNQISTKFEMGQVTGVIGANGSGKSTLFKLITNYFQAPPNTIFFNESDLCLNPIYGKSHISMCFETPSIISKMTVKENMSYYNILFKKDEARISEILNELDLIRYSNYRVSKLSFGLKQRVNIAVMLLRDTDILICDEPFNGLDPQSVTTLRNLFINYSLKEKSVIVSAHILSEIEKIADKVLILSNGRVIFDNLNPQKYSINYSLVECMDTETNRAALKGNGLENFVSRNSKLFFSLSDKKVGGLNVLENYKVYTVTNQLEEIYNYLSK